MTTNNHKAALMEWVWRTGVTLAAICLCAPAAIAAQSRFGEGSSEAFVDRVTTAQTGEYQRVLAEFDAHLARHPADAIASVERCKFIDAFTYLDEIPIETAPEDQDQCVESLRAGPNTQSGAVKLYLWSQDSWKDSIPAGENLLKEYSSWTTSQRAELHEELSRRYELTGDPLKAGEHAVKAVELDRDSDLRLQAAEHYVRIGAKRRAVSTIEGMPSKGWRSWTLQSGVTMLLNLGDTAAANRLVEANKDIDLTEVSRIKLAGSMLDAGEEEAGRALIQKLRDSRDASETFGTQLERELFYFQLKYGSADDAQKAYRALRNKGFTADAFARHRLALTATHWRSPWQWADLTGVAALVVFFAFMGLLPLVAIVPVHYRSAVRLSKGLAVAPLTPESPWTLGNAWYALAATLSAELIAFYVFSYSDFEAAFGYWFGVTPAFETPSDERALGRALFWGSLASLVLLLPLLRNAKVAAVLFGKWSKVQSILTGAGMAILLLVVGNVFRTVFGAFSDTGIGLGTDTVRSLQGVHSVFGVLALFGCGAVIVPIIEELTYRGVLLRASARHVHFWLAALVQAAIFVVIHEDTSAYPFLFVFAMTNSWLALRSGGLLASITLHAVNNGFATLAILGLTWSVN